MYFILFLHNWINKLFSEENKVPEHCLKNIVHINKVEQYESVLSFKVSLFIQS